MSVFNEIGRKIEETASRLEKKNRRQANLNRIRSTLKREERGACAEYIALGRYYYNNLRDRNDSVTEAHCRELEQIERRMNVAIAQLSAYHTELQEEKVKRAAAKEAKEDRSIRREADAEALKQAEQQAKEAVEAASATARQETVGGNKGDLKEGDVSAAAGNVPEKRAERDIQYMDVKNRLIQEPVGQIHPNLAADENENDNLPFAD